MNFITNEKGALKANLVDPSQCEPTDIEGFHTQRDDWSLEKVDELAQSIKRHGVRVAAIGYVEDGKIKLIDGVQRSKILLSLKENKEKINLLGSEKGEIPMLPVTLIAKPKTEQDVHNALLARVDVNNIRFGDDAATLHQLFSYLSNQGGMSLQQIGESCGFSHTQVDRYLRAFVDSNLAKAVIAGKIDVIAASDLTRAEGVGFKRDKKTGVISYDKPALKKALESALKQAQETGGKPIRIASTQGQRGSRAQSAEGAISFKTIIKVLLDQPQGEVPPEILFFLKWASGKLSDASLKQIAKRNGLDFDWLFALLTSKAFNKKAKPAKVAKATKAAKANPLVEAEEDEDDEDYESEE